MSDYEDSYVGKLRKKVGTGTLILPAVRAVIQDEHGSILFIQRSDNRKWALPAGGMELGESVTECLKREVKEETGLDVIAATPIALHSEPRFTFVDGFGNSYQMFALIFRVDEWKGKLLRKTEETLDAQFFPKDKLPVIPPHYHETLADLQNFDGRIIVK